MKKNPVFTAFITKYALTKGIYSVKVEQCVDISEDMVCEREAANPSKFFGEGKEWHRTYDGALEQALKMRNDKIDSLKRQINRLNKLTFE